MKVREAFGDPNFSNFTKEAVKVGEAVEALGYELEDETYSQGIQSFNFRKGESVVSVHIGED